MVRAAKRELNRALIGVGVNPTILYRGKIALHARRSLSEQEMAQLSCEWLAIPAQDEFAEDGEVEMAL